jgi:hypothetical protein
MECIVIRLGGNKPCETEQSLPRFVKIVIALFPRVLIALRLYTNDCRGAAICQWAELENYLW